MHFELITIAGYSTWINVNHLSENFIIAVWIQIMAKSVLSLAFLYHLIKNNLKWKQLLLLEKYSCYLIGLSKKEPPMFTSEMFTLVKLGRDHENKNFGVEHEEHLHQAEENCRDTTKLQIHWLDISGAER